MQVATHTVNGLQIAELQAAGLLVRDGEEGAELVGNLYYAGIECVVIYANQLHADFFDLKTGLAGEVLQKFTNYRLRVAIVGDFRNYSSQSLQDFIYESNKGRQVYFLPSLKEALAALGRKGGI